MLKKLLLVVGVFSIASLNAMNNKRLRTRKANGAYEKTILYHVINNDKKAIKECLKKGESIDFQGRSNGQTLLHSTLFHNKIGLIKWLLARGARTDIKDIFGQTVLEHAQESLSEEIRHLFTPENIARLKEERLARKQEKLLKQEPIRKRLLDYAVAHPENPMLSDLPTLATLRTK